MKGLALSTLCTIVLVVSACTDATQPPPIPDGPRFSHGGPSETICQIFISGTHDNVTVPPGQTCFVSGATILGNVKALQDANLFVLNSTVQGNVEGDGPDALQVFGGSTVGGNIFVTGAGISPPVDGFTTVFIGSVGGLGGITTVLGDVHVLKASANTIFVSEVNFVNGSLKVEDNFTLGLLIINNQVAQNLQVFKNESGGFKNVFGNVVGENLQCFENSPPFLGGPNTAKHAEGQCFAGPATAATAANTLDYEELLEQQGFRLTTDERGAMVLETIR